MAIDNYRHNCYNQTMETLNSSLQQGSTDWSGLADTSKPDAIPPGIITDNATNSMKDHYEKILNRAHLYRKFGSIANTICVIE